MFPFAPARPNASAPTRFASIDNAGEAGGTMSDCAELIFSFSCSPPEG